ncbi:MAG: hypothetical protein ABFS10_04155 [Bacteroidota bacterium]
MRFPTITLVLLLVVAFSGCEQPIDMEKEKEAIIKVINEETDAYLARDFEAMYATHLQDSTNIRLTAGADNFVFAEGWEDVSQHMSGDETEDDLGSDLHITVEKSNYRMKVCPSSAFVICDQKWISTYGEDVTEINSIQVRFLENIEGEWKISFVSFIGTSGYDEVEDLEELVD